MSNKATHIATPYTDRFYEDARPGSRLSAAEIVPLVSELVHPTSVVDVGCGVGAWLAEFKQHGVKQVLGIDGGYVNRTTLEIEPDEFLDYDLKQPLNLDKQFDLAMSLEVAEHLPADCAGAFIHSLTGLAPVVLFSAAIPYQSGTHHVNEQWPEYWAKLFNEQGYIALDSIRRQVWQNVNVEWFYAQNILVFVKESKLLDYPGLQEAAKYASRLPLSLVHPIKYLWMAEWLESISLSVKELNQAIPSGCKAVIIDDGTLPVVAPREDRNLGFQHLESIEDNPLPTDAETIEELEKRRQSGASFIAFAWPAFWWLDYYPALAEHLSSRYSCILKNERWVIFDLRKAS